MSKISSQQSLVTQLGLWDVERLIGKQNGSFNMLHCSLKLDISHDISVIVAQKTFQHLHRSLWFRLDKQFFWGSSTGTDRKSSCLHATHVCNHFITRVGWDFLFITDHVRSTRECFQSCLSCSGWWVGLLANWSAPPPRPWATWPSLSPPPPEGPPEGQRTSRRTGLAWSANLERW